MGPISWLFGGSRERSREAERAQFAAELEERDRKVAELAARLAACEIQKRNEMEKDVLTQEIIPFSNQALLGGTLGYCSGYALRLVGRVAAVGVGCGFMAIQALSYMGYVRVDWRKVERDYLKQLDRDGDGQVTHADFEMLWKDFTSVLAFNLPAGTGFTGGLLYGLNVASATRAAGVAAVAGASARMLLPRVALGGVGATGVPAFVVAIKRQFGVEDEPLDKTLDDIAREPGTDLGGP